MMSWMIRSSKKNILTLPNYVSYSIKEFVNDLNAELTDQAYMVVDNQAYSICLISRCTGYFCF